MTNWQDDPILKDEITERIVRAGLWRTVIIWTPPFLLAGFGFLYFLSGLLFGTADSGIFLVLVLGGLGGLFGFQAVQAMLDLRAAPAFTEGVVTRRWAARDAFVMKTHYIRLGGKLILRGEAGILEHIEGGQRVAVRYFPHSAVIIGVKKVAEDAGPAEPAP